jgi:hypothetical protein
MKNQKILATILISGSLLLMSCENQETPESYKNFKTYSEVMDENIERDWEEFDTEFQTRKDAVERDMEQMSEMEKKEFEEIQERYNTKKREMEEDAEMKRKEAEMNSPSQKMYVIVNAPEKNMALEGVTAENIAMVYTNFVDFIKVNQDAMSLEDWKEAELIWDALNERKNVVEPDLKSENNMEIAKEKVQYATLKTKNKPGAKIDEKQNTEMEKEMNE